MTRHSERSLERPAPERRGARARAQRAAMCAYFAVGVPRVLRCLPEEGGARHEAVLSLAFAHCGSALLAVVTTTTLQVWGGGQASAPPAAASAPLALR
jgi:hypothetical protein